MAEWTGEPAYKQIAADLRRAAAKMAVGDQLPSNEELATRHGVSKPVARDAIRLLVNEGIAVTHQGKGAFIRRVPTSTELGQEEPGSGFDVVMRRLDEVEQQMGRLAGRLAELEQERSTGRRGRSGQRVGPSSPPAAP